MDEKPFKHVQATQKVHGGFLITNQAMKTVVRLLAVSLVFALNASGQLGKTFSECQRTYGDHKTEEKVGDIVFRTYRPAPQKRIEIYFALEHGNHRAGCIVYSRFVGDAKQKLTGNEIRPYLYGNSEGSLWSLVVNKKDQIVWRQDKQRLIAQYLPVERELHIATFDMMQRIGAVMQAVAAKKSRLEDRKDGEEIPKDEIGNYVSVELFDFEVLNPMSWLEKLKGSKGEATTKTRISYRLKLQNSTENKIAAKVYAKFITRKGFLVTHTDLGWRSVAPKSTEEYSGVIALRTKEIHRSMSASGVEAEASVSKAYWGKSPEAFDYEEAMRRWNLQ